MFPNLKASTIPTTHAVNNANRAIFICCASEFSTCCETSADISSVLKGILLVWICSAIFKAFSMVVTIIEYSPAKAAMAKIDPITYFFKKKCPAPGRTKAESKAALIDFFMNNTPFLLC